MTSFLAQHYIDACLDTASGRLALSFPNEDYNYNQLLKASNKLGNYLRQANLNRQDRVAIYLKRSPKSIIAMLGVLKADGICVVIDGKAPSKRLHLVIEDCSPSAIICDKTTANRVAELLPGLNYRPLIIILGEKQDLSIDSGEPPAYQDLIDQQSDHIPNYQNIDTDIAQIIYTSGSTGKPKGVMISHLNIVNYIDWAVGEFQICQDDVILGTAPFHFDMSTFDIFCSLKAGCTFCITPDTYLLFPKKLIGLIDQQKVTIWKGISSLLMYLAITHSLDNNDIPTLKKIIFAGEVFSTKYLIEWMKRYPEKKFYNGYGPSESTGMSTFYKVENIPKDPKEQIPIGKACSNCEVILLNEDLSMTEIGRTGEICIRGSGVSCGYWNDPAKTREVFITNPLTDRTSDRIYKTGDLGVCDKNGNITFIGRKDQQVKWMGYRIELGEIESTLISFDEINDAVVFLHQNSSSEAEKELIACVEALENSDLILTLDKLSKHLPHYMVPKKLIPVDKIPRSDRGKVDRKKLLKQYSTSLLS
jgi:amino acid adenylation domain-containing protein